jgi:hypothetical protein
MSLLPRTTLHSDSEQFIYNWMLEDDLDLDEETGKEPNRREEKRTKSWKGLNANTISNSLYPGSRAGSRSGRKKTQETKEKDTSRDEDSRKPFPAVMLNQGLTEKRHGRKKALYKTGWIYTETELWVIKEITQRERKEKGNCKKTDQELEQDRNRIVSGQIAIPETGRTRIRPSPTPGQRLAVRARPLPSPTPSPPLPPSHSRQPVVSSTSVCTQHHVEHVQNCGEENKRRGTRTCQEGFTQWRESTHEASFFCTSCHILGLDGEVALKAIALKAKEKGGRQPRKVLDKLQLMLVELGERVDKHKRPTLNPTASTRAVIPWECQRAAWHTCRAAQTR